MSGHSGALKPGTLGLSFTAKRYNDAGAGDVGVLTTHETVSMEKVMSAKTARVSVGRSVNS